MELGSGIGKWNWEVELGSGIGKWNWEVELGSGIGKWNWEVELGSGIGKWNWEVELGSGIGKWNWEVVVDDNSYWYLVISISHQQLNYINQIKISFLFVFGSGLDEEETLISH